MAAGAANQRDEIRHRDAVDAAGYSVIYHCMTQDPLLSDGAFRTYILLLSYAWQTKRCWPGQEVLARERGCNLRTIRRHLDELREIGLLTIERRGDKQTNLYILENIHDAYGKREDKNVRSTDGTKMSGRDGTKMSDLLTGQKCPPNRKQQKHSEGKLQQQGRARAIAEPKGGAAAVIAPSVSDPDATHPVVSMSEPIASLVASLVGEGVNRVDAARLAAEVPQECRRQLRLAEGMTDADFEKSKGAYLRWAIENAAGPPPGWKERQKERQREQRAAAAAKKAGADPESLAERQRLQERDARVAAARAELERGDPEGWARVLADAEARLPAPLRGKAGHVAYRPALEARVNEIVAGSLP